MNCKKKIMRKYSGFSLLEVMVVMAIIFIIASISTPPLLRWRTDAQLRGAASNLRGDLELAKLRAVRENSFVAVLFNANDYIIFVDDGASPGDWVEDADETQIRNGQLPEGVYIVMPTALADDRTRFDGRGTAANSGTIIIQNIRGKQKQISINRLGLINLQ
jgi:prepilin-type N-terminal cleavage/methylation domain-containing protein